MQRYSTTSENKPEISEDTLRALRAGEEWAYNEVYLRFASPLRDFLAKLIRSEHDAEELNHDIFLALWADREKIRPEKGIAGFLYQRAKHLALNWFAHKKVRAKYEEFCAGGDSDYDLSPDEQVIVRETRILTEIALRRMSARKQDIWHLSRAEGLSPDDIARRLGISPSTVRNNLTEITKSLREVLSLFVIVFLP